MSDYLWDKTGEADPEVERLESLLSGFAHRPRPLELPKVERPARRAPLLKYAAAAAVLLAVLAGAFVALKVRQHKDAGPVAGAKSQPTVEPSRAEQEGTPISAPSVLAHEYAHDLRPRESRGTESASKSQRPRRHTASERAPRRSRPNSSEAAPQLAESAERLRAKEQLVYALRLTGVKLEEVRRKVQGEGDAEVVPEGRSRTR